MYGGRSSESDPACCLLLSLCAVGHTEDGGASVLTKRDQVLFDGKRKYTYACVGAGARAEGVIMGRLVPGRPAADLADQSERVETEIIHARTHFLGSLIFALISFKTHRSFGDVPTAAAATVDVINLNNTV